nr:MAG TPA: hypothetical protein [Microviridae sp.]
MRPSGFTEDPSGRTGARASGPSVRFHRLPLLTDMTAAPSPTHRPLRARAFLQKA